MESQVRSMDKAQIIQGGKTKEFNPRTARYAFVPPRFAESIAGGAETLIGSLASRLGARGNHVEIFTTCAIDNRTWENHFPEGSSLEMGIPVRRFKVDPRDLETWIPRQIQINEGMNIGVDEELLWMQESVNSKNLYAHIARHAHTFDAIFFGPYLFGTTFWGSLIAPEKSVLIPCLHDEHYAYTQTISSMFRQIKGALFNAGPEADLARALYGKIHGGEVGMGFVPWKQEYVQNLKPYFAETFPYLIYVGRKETGKNVQVLIDYFIEGKTKGVLPSDLKLVIVGGGSFSDLHRPEALTRGDVLDISHVTEEEKHRLIRFSSALCQPSVNESFSIVMMESWLLDRPVIVHASCPVTRYHAVSSGGGLYFSNSSDFSGVVGEILDSAELSATLGRSGFRYVEERYSWDAVLERFDSVMEDLLK